MKKLTNLWLILILISFVLLGCKNKSTSLQTETLINEDLNGVSTNDMNHYEITIELDNENKSFTGEQKILFTKYNR